MTVVAVNQKLRLARGEHGTVVITAAWCGRCRRDVMPRDDGRCSWCDARIVDEDVLPAKRLRELLAAEGDGATFTAEDSGREPQAVDDATVDVVPVAASDLVTENHAVEELSGPELFPPRRTVRRWDADDVKARLLHFESVKGRRPTFADINEHPYLPTVGAAPVWRQVAVALGWPDPAAPKRAPRNGRRAPAATNDLVRGSEGDKQRDPLAGGKSHPIQPPGTGSNDVRDARNGRASSVTARRDGQSFAPVMQEGSARDTAVLLRGLAAAARAFAAQIESEIGS